MKKINIKQKWDSGDCETCGCYSYVTSEIDLDGDKFELYGDNHTSGGPMGNAEVLEEIFRKLGYEIHWEESD